MTLTFPPNETKRVETLKRYDVLDTPPDGSFDKMTALAAKLFDVPIAIISLVDTERIWFKSHYGLPINQIGRDPGLCASAILSSDPYVIENAIEDPRTLANPLVAGEFGLRFYAAAPLQTEDNYNLGTLCIIDKEPRAFTQDQKEILKQMAAIVMDEMERRLSLRNAVSNIRNISVDITANLDDTIQRVKSVTKEDESDDIIPYLEASRMYLKNLQMQLNELE